MSKAFRDLLDMISCCACCGASGDEIDLYKVSKDNEITLCQDCVFDFLEQIINGLKKTEHSKTSCMNCRVWIK